MDTGAISRDRQEPKWSSRCEKLVGAFDPGELLGQGHYGEVIKAKSKMDDIDYAIKIVKIDDEDPEFYRREVKNLAALYHSNVVRYHTSWIEKTDILKDEYEALHSDSSQSSDQASDNSTSTSEEGYQEKDYPSPHSEQSSSDHVIFVPEKSSNDSCSPSQEDNTIQINLLVIQMELCSHDLRREIDDMNLYRDEAKSMKYFREICEGLAYIHRNGIIHRDLKPGNIFISDSGSVKIGDFNLSRRIPQNSGHATGSQESLTLSENCGTNVYIAPEMMNNSYDEKVDMYSLGVIFYEMSSRKMTDSEKTKIFPLHETSNWSAVTSSLNSPQKVDLLRELLEPNAQERLSSEVLTGILEMKITKEQIKNTIKSSTATNSQMTAYDTILKSYNNKLEQTRDFLKDAVEVFEIHNGENIPMPLLQPKRRSDGNAVSLMTEHGHIVSLSNNSRIAFCKHLQADVITNKRRYSVGKLFEGNSARFPKEVQECVFDVISPNEHDFMIEAEMLYIIKTIIRKVFPEDAIQRVEFYFNHALIFREILLKYLQKADISNLLRMSSKQWITLLEARDMGTIEEHCRILHVSRTKLKKLKQFARPIAISNASSFLENQQEFSKHKMRIAIRNIQAISKSVSDFKIDNVYLSPLLITDEFPNKIMCQAVVKTTTDDSEVIASVDRFDHLLKRYIRGYYEFSAVGLSFNVAKVVEMMQLFPLPSKNNDDLCVLVVQDKAHATMWAKKLWNQKIRCVVITEEDFHNGYLDQYKDRFNVRLLKLPE